MKNLDKKQSLERLPSEEAIGERRLLMPPRRHLVKKMMAERFVAAALRREGKAFQNVTQDGSNVTESTSNPEASELSHPVDIGEDKSSRPDHDSQKVELVLEWMFVITNFVLELPSAVFDQLSLSHKPKYALACMLMSFAAIFICIIALVYRGRKERVHWRWKGKLPWFYYQSERHIPFGDFKDIIGLVCALCQAAVTTVNYAFSLQHADNPIKISVWPIVFAFGVLCSKFLQSTETRAISDR